MCIRDRFNDPGVNTFFNALTKKLFPKEEANLATGSSEKQFIIPPSRVRYLSEITETIHRYDKEVELQAAIASNLYALEKTMALVQDTKGMTDLKEELTQSLLPENKEILDNWEGKKASYQGEHFTYKVRDKEFKVENYTKTLSQNKIPKITLPKYLSLIHISEPTRPY